MILFRVKIMLKHEIIFKENHQCDTLWIYANNPESAKMRAIRWYDFYKPGRRELNKALDFVVTVESRPIDDAMKLKRTDIVLYQYAVWYKVKPGYKRSTLVSLSFGQDQGQAKKMSKMFFPIIADESDVIGLHCITRLKEEKL